MGLRFEWDPRKARVNLSKHSVSFEEAVTVFTDPFARIFDDPDHSIEEPREMIIGLSRMPLTTRRLGLRDPSFFIVLALHFGRLTRTKDTDYLPAMSKAHNQQPMRLWAQPSVAADPFRGGSPACAQR
jgi:hypothetical protein